MITLQRRTFGPSDLADNGLLLLLGVRLRYDEGEDANSSKEDGDLHSDGGIPKTHDEKMLGLSNLQL